MAVRVRATVSRPPRGLIYVLGATALAGVSGYAIQLLAAALLPGAAEYLTFSVFWSMTFLFGAAVGGVQHEIARAARPAPATAPHRSVHTFTLIAGVAAGVGGFAVVGLLGPVTLDQRAPAMIAPFVVAAVGYVLTSVLTGLLYGIGRLGTVALLIAVDALLRGVVVVGGLLLGVSAEVLAWAISLPFGFAVGLVWLIARGRVVGAYSLDVGTAQVVRNSVRTVAASAATGLMVTGMPVLFRLAMTDATPVVIASVTLAVTITRAPLIIPIMAVQSFLVVSFRNDGAARAGRLARYLIVIALVGAVAAGAAWFLGPPVVGWVSTGRYEIDALSSAVIVCSAGLVACLCVTGPVLLAASRHTAYALGWIVAAAVTVVSIFWLPLPAVPRALTAITFAPVTGICVHLAALWWSARRGSGRPAAAVSEL